MAANPELEKGKKLLKDQTDEVGFLDNAFKSLAATISTTLEDAIDQMNGLDTITKKVAQSYQKDIANSIKKTTSGLEETIALQLKIKQGVNVEADLKKKMDALEVRRIATLKKIMMAGKELGIDTMELKVQLKEQYDLELKLLGAMKKQNAETQKAKPLFQLLKENAGSIADKIDKSGTLSKVLKGGIGSVLTPMRLLELAIVGVFDAMTAIDKQNGKLAKNLNINVSEAAALSSKLSTAANNSGELSITTLGLGEALMAANGELGIFNTTIDDNLILFEKLHKTAGLTYGELKGVKSITDATGGDLEKNTKEIMAQARLTGQKFGVALNEKEVLKDISNVSKATTLSLGKNPGQIANAVAATKALGMEMSKVEGIADSLLNFESSIEKELEAELLLGKDINLEKARQAALNNDIAGVAEEIAKQAGSAADFGKMNRIQQQALADAVGMSREDLASSLFVQEQIGNLTGEEYKLREKQIKGLQAEGLSQDEIKAKLGKQSIEDLKNQNSVQENLNKSVSKMKEVFMSIAAPLMQIITPIVELLIPALQSIQFILAPVFDTFKGIAGILTGNIESLGTMEKIMGVIGGLTLAYLGYQKSIVLFEGIRANLTASRLVMETTSTALENSKKKGIFSTIGAMTIQLGIQLGILSASLASNAAVTFGIGVAIAVAAAAAGYAAIKALTGDDIMSPGSNSSGYGSRTLFGPEGAIALNNKDTVIAGTNLFKGNDVVSSPAGAIQMPDNSEAKRTNQLLQSLINRPEPKVQMDSIEVGTVAGMSAFSIQ